MILLAGLDASENFIGGAILTALRPKDRQDNNDTSGGDSRDA